jgi:transcriptional regulator of acetoin/glycerol metabolism
MKTNSRLSGIAHARQTVLAEGGDTTQGHLAPWVQRSWQRCLAGGLQADAEAHFEILTGAHIRHTTETNAHLVQTARPLLQGLGRAIVNTRYFAILTNVQGVVVDVDGGIDRSDVRADIITRIGTDLSEAKVGTTAIGTALAELQPVWLHRGEHFFANTSHYSCAGAPLIGPDGRCVGMLDVTGIDVQERPELKHLVAQTASRIENALVLSQKHALCVRLNWSGNALGGEGDGIVCLDGDGWVTGANPIARQMVAHLATPGEHPPHASEVFGAPFEMLFDTARHHGGPVEIPLWSGLRLQALPLAQTQELQAQRSPGRPLRDIEYSLIREAVDQAQGNVAQAALALGISRATVYRKLGKAAAVP